MAQIKKPKVQKTGNYRPDNIYTLPMTPDQKRKYNKLSMNPKTADTLFSLPKGTTKLSKTEKSQIQDRRIIDRQRTLSRAAQIIRRDTGVKTVGPVAAKSKPKPKTKTKTTFG